MDFDLRKHTHLLTIAGSRAYGMQIPTSDIDVKGVCIPPKKYILGSSSAFHQADAPEHMSQYLDLFSKSELEVIKKTKLEGSVYSLQKFIKLAQDANPSILDILFCRDEEVRYITPIGKKLRDNRDLFISAKVKHAFCGYAFAQLKRINLHRRWLLNPAKEKPLRENYGLPSSSEKNNQAALSMVEKVLDSWELNLSGLDKSSIVQILQKVKDFMAELSISVDDKWMAAGRTLGINDDFLQVLYKEKEFKKDFQDYHNYENWKKHRNPVRAKMEEESGYDRKHAAHCVRLLNVSREILETGKVNIWRANAEELLSIRDGAWSYEELMTWVEKEDQEQTLLYKALSKEEEPLIPMRPNIEKIEELCIDLIQEELERNAY